MISEETFDLLQKHFIAIRVMQPLIISRWWDCVAIAGRAELDLALKSFLSEIEDVHGDGHKKEQNKLHQKHNDSAFVETNEIGVEACVDWLSLGRLLIWLANTAFHEQVVWLGYGFDQDGSFHCSETGFMIN